MFFLMIRRPSRSTRTDTSFPTRRSSDLRESNPGARICSPLRHHSAIGPERGQMRKPAPHVNRHAHESGATFLARSGARDTSRSRSEEHTSELQSLMRISYAVFCLKKKTK